MIKLTLGGIEYTGVPLTLDSLRALRKSALNEFDLDVVTLWLGDEETVPKVAKPGRLSIAPPEVAMAVKTILSGSGFELGEAGAEAV